ncbi:MAG TPA: type II toxin-antitoxin system death-on-curing family toxin [Anaerohalosphaeraceae bacterium]|jgi:death-on-curing protein|nr:type II toxin-antitoxin system death-on-curing family toxin [Anaerohalosphaeraceae bacterium]HRT50644.1 type II toxin-antitoxin system death-on-curing family toxin [Anaerohalosphaeraceae bacterium]HRT86531.1 type II toxin-antitoxin system death-on-curing family toxin [Anaerohalosphaeraceae bacterium]
MAIDFLTVQDIVRIHDRLIREHGGDPNVRDEGLLLSAVAVPQAAFFGDYAHADPCEMAAAYLFHILMNHPFVDGNKRTAVAAAIVFLEMNGMTFTADNDTVVEFALELAQGKKTKAQTIEFIRANAL